MVAQSDPFPAQGTQRKMRCSMQLGARIDTPEVSTASLYRAAPLWQNATRAKAAAEIESIQA
jgi:hypothetical protein